MRERISLPLVIPIITGRGPLGVCRTYVFTQDTSEQGILDAIRERRTVVYDRGQVYGDPALIRLAAQDGRLPSAGVAHN